MTDVRRTQHDLGEEPGERARFDGDGAALPVERGAGDPAAAAGEVGDDVAGAGVGLDAGREQARSGAPARSARRRAATGSDRDAWTRYGWSCPLMLADDGQL